VSPSKSTRWALAALLIATLGLSACSSSGGGSGDKLTTYNIGAETRSREVDPRSRRRRHARSGRRVDGTILAGGTILWPGPENTLYALSKTGTLLWSEKFDGQVLSPAVAGMDRVYVADLTGHLKALQVTGATHRVLWSLDVGGTDYGSPTVGQDGTIYTASDDDLVGVRDLGARGAVLFRFQANKMVEVSNAVAPNGTVVLGTNHDKEFGIAPDGSTKWSFDVGDYTYSSSVVRPDGTGYFGDNMGRLHVIDTATGKQLMTIAPLGAGKEKIWTSVAADAKGDFYWGTTAGNIYGYSAAGKQLFHVSAGASINSYPAIDATGTLYLGTTAGKLYAIG
jgi:outer membrane protein assembly factor BamB